MKPLFLKTYGKQKRKLSAWLSPQNHKLAFDSTFSSDGETSVFEPPKPTKTRKKRTSVASHRVVRPARKKKAIIHLMENSSEDKCLTNVENVMIPPFAPSIPAQHSKSKRRKKSGVCSDRAVRPAKRKASCLKINSSDEENLFKASPSNPQQNKTTRKSQLVSESSVSVKQNPGMIPATSYSEKNSVSALQSRTESVQMKRSSNVPSVGRFVTRRRRGTTAKRQLPKKSILNSSDDFSLESFACSRNVRPFKRRLPPTFILSSAENSLNVAETSRVTSKALREISLNESSDHGLGPTTRKPIFCSTPSAQSLRKHPRLEPFPVHAQASTPLSMSVSCIGSLSPFQKAVDSSDPTTSQGSDQSSEHHSNRNQHLGLSKKETVLNHHETPSGDLFIESKYTPTSTQIENHSEEPKTMSSEELPLLNLLSTDSQSSSYFMTTAEALEWLIEALKEKCLTERCTVQLERLDSLTVTQLCSETTYSSCLGEEHFVQSSPNIQQVSVVNNETSEDHRRSSEESVHLCLSVTDTKNSNFLWSVNSLNSSEQGAFLTDNQSISHSPSVDCKYLSTSEFIKQTASVVYDESIHHVNSSTECNTGTQVPASSCLQTEDMDAVKEKYLVKKCTIHLNKLSFSELTFKQLKECTQHNESHLAYDENSSNPASTKGSQDNDQTHNTENPTNLEYVCKIHDNDQETTKFLKKKCLSNKLTVNVKKATLSEFKAALDLKDKNLKSPTVVSDSASDDQSVSEIDHSNEETFTVSANMKKKTSIRSNYKVSSDTKKVGDNSCDMLPKEKKISQRHKERKRRSTSVDRPGTTRKACVSGLSVNRWKNKGTTSANMIRKQVAPSGHIKAVDCSIFELISTEHKQQGELGTTMNFSTPVRAIPLNVSSLLADLTPNSNTWSRFKAALAVHRKGIARLTPRTLAVSGSPGRTNLADISQDLFATPFRTPLPKHLKSQLHRNDSLVECEDLSDAEKVYAECGQRGPLPWEECIPPHRMKKCVKIGEGTFGEVFSTTNASGDTVALKIIPVEGSEKVNGEDQKTFGEILHEIIISKELSSLKEKLHNQTCGFIGLNDLHCVQGCYPPDFLNAWDKFDQHKGSENDRPDFFQKDQTFIILEFEFGGIDLENSNGTLASLGVAKSILHQVTAALAVAEQELHFEHRDLHWGNVLVKTTKQKTGSFLLNGMNHSLETKGVLVRIIDYSLSRLEIDDLTVSCDISKDEELFMGQGDYQFEIYRLMRNENGNNWSDYHPHTNILWLHYLSSKLLSMKYRGTGGRGAKEIREELTRFHESILQYSSATEALQNCPMFQ